MTEALSTTSAISQAAISPTLFVRLPHSLTAPHTSPMSGNVPGEVTDSVLLASSEALENFSDDVKCLWCPRNVPVLDRPPSPVTFLRDYVSKSTPCIIRSAITSYPNQSLTLTLDDLVDHCREDLVLTVDVTPDGFGDCVRTVKDGEMRKRMFVKPQEREMAILQFRDKLRLGRREQSLVCSCSEVDNGGNAIFPLETADCRCDDDGREEKETNRTFCDDNEVLYYSRQVRKNVADFNGQKVSLVR